jgi:hypothetical protein
MKDMGSFQRVKTLQRALSLIAPVETGRDHEAHFLRSQAWSGSGSKYRP